MAAGSAPSRALAAALAAVAFALVTSDIWRLADALGPLRLAVLGIASVALTVVALIVAHGLWSAQHRTAPPKGSSCSTSPQL